MKVTREQARDMAAAHAEGMHADLPREGCPECEGRELRDYPAAEKYRVDVQAFGETAWASNALRFDTEGEAETYARNLFARWTAMVSWRVVPESTPEREQVAS